MKKLATIVMILAFTCLGVSAMGANAPTGMEITNLDTVNKELDALLKRTESAKPVSAVNERAKQFSALHQELGKMDDKIDMLKQKAKADLEAGKMTWAEYRETKLKINALRDRVNHAEERLAEMFGMNGK